ncbi:MAG: hypothetical protein ACE5LS_04975 [Thermoplasmata archaeon]
MTALQLVGLALGAAGAFLLVARPLSRFQVTAEEEARERWLEDFTVGTVSEDNQEERQVRKEYLPGVRRERAADLLGAVLLGVGFVLQGVGLAFGL